MKFLISEQLIDNLAECLNQEQKMYFVNRLQMIIQSQIPFTAPYLIKSENKYLFEIIQGATLENRDKSQYVTFIKRLEKQTADQGLQRFQNLLIQLQEEYKITQNNVKKNTKLSIINKHIGLVNKYFTKYKWQLLEQPTINQIYSYILDELDFISKAQIQYPQVFLSKETLLHSPGLVDQQNSVPMKQCDRLTNMLVIHIFEVRDQIASLFKQELQIQIFPSQFNFNFLVKNSNTPYFANYTHLSQFVYQNSIKWQQSNNIVNYFLPALFQGYNIKLNLFDFWESESIQEGQYSIKYNKSRKENTPEFTQFWMSIYYQKFKKTDIEGIQVELKEFEYLHSIDCNVTNQIEYLEHKIDPQTFICQKCKQKVQDFGSLFYDLKFYQFYQSLRDILLSPHYMDIPGVYICPIMLRMVRRNKIHEICSEVVNNHSLIVIYNHQIEIGMIQDLEQEDQQLDGIRERNMEWLLSELN